jgi:hypothetical protein
MSTKTKTLAKSLHTITAIAAVARLHIASGNMPSPLPALAVGLALETLGYAGAADPYGLADKARAILERN